MPLWLTLVSRLPWAFHHALSTFTAAVLRHVARYRLDVVRENLARAFPDLSSAERREIERGYFQNIGDLVGEVLKSASLPPEELRRRVRMPNLHLVREELDAGRPVLIVAAHQCNWEWMLLALSLDLGYPLDAAYKPLRGYGDRIMRAIRSRFGGRLVPAKTLLADLISKRGEVRAIAMVADQEPTTSEFKWWTRFLNQETAFYMGPEKIARAVRFPVLFASMRRIARGHYEVRFEPIAAARENLPTGALTERYAKLVEAEIRAQPGDWIWSHRRWRLRRDDSAPEEDEPETRRESA